MKKKKELDVVDIPIGVAFCYDGGIYLRIYPANTSWEDDCEVVALVLKPCDHEDAIQAYEICSWPYHTKVTLFGEE